MSTKMSVVCRIMLFLLMISGCNKQSYQSQTAATNQPQPIQTVQAAAPEALEKTEPHENNNVQSSSQSADLDEHSPAENGLVEVRKVPKCPSGSQEHTWKTSKGKIGYRCHVGDSAADDKWKATTGMTSPMCVEWEGTHWSTVDVHVPCGSTVSSATDESYIQAETSQRVSVKSTVSQVMPATASDCSKSGPEPGQPPNITAKCLKIASARWVTIGTTDANGYRRVQGPPIQRLLAVIGTLKLDVLCYGTYWSTAFGMDQNMKCPTLAVGKTYLLEVGAKSVEANIPNTKKRAAWQILEWCEPSGCQKISTLRDR